MAEFKSSARRIAFNPVTLPDTASDYLREEEKRIGKLKEAYDADINNRTQYADALEKKQEVEARNVESNSRLKEKFNESYAKHLKERYRQINQKEEDKNKAYETRLANMAKFSQKAGDELKAFGERRAENQQNIGFNLYNETGIDPRQLQEYRLKMAELESEGIAEAEYIASLQAKGVDVASLRRVEGLSGWRLVGAQKAMAQKAGSDWQAFTQNPERRKKQYDIGDGTMMSLEEAMNSQDPNESHFNNVLTQMRLEFTKAYSDLSPEFSHDYFWPGVNDVTETLQKQFHTKDQEAYRAAEVENDITLVSNFLLEKGDLSTLHGHLGGGNLGFQRLHVAVNKLIEIGDFGLAELEALENSILFKDGKNVSYLEAFGKGKGKKGSYMHRAFLDAARTSIHNRSNNDRKIIDAQKKAAYEVEVQKIMALARDKGVSPSAMQEWSTMTYEKYGIRMDDTLKSYLTNETYGVAEAEALLEEQWRDGTLTSEELKKKAYSQIDPQRRQYWERLAGTYEERASSEQMKADEADILGLIKGNLKLASSFAISGEANSVHFRVVQDYRSLVRRNLDKGEFSSTFEAVNNAREKIVKSLQEGKTGKGPYALNLIEGTDQVDFENPGFQMLRSTTSPHQATSNLQRNFRELYKEDNDVIEKDFLFGRINDPQSLISRIHTGYRNGGPIPEAIKDIAVQDLDRNVHQIINSQLEKYKLDKIEPSRDQSVVYATDPEFRRLITNMPSVGRVSRGLVNTNYKNGVVGVPAYKPILDLIASKESANDTVHNGYDSLNTGGTDGGHTAYGSSTGTKKFQKPLTEMTVEEVMNLQNDGVLHATGRYQIIRSTLANVVRQVGLDPKTTKYDEATQDLLAIHLLWGRVGKQLSTDGQALVGLGQEWVGLQYVSAADKINALERTKSDPRFKNFDPVRLYPNLVRK